MGALAIWELIKTFKTPILIVAGVLMISGSIGYYGHTRFKAAEAKYEKQIATLKVALATEKADHAADVKTWEAINTSIKARNAVESARKDQIIETTQKQYEQAKSALTKEQQERKATIHEVFKSGDTITVPHSFSVLYNEAVGGHGRPVAAGTKEENLYGLAGQVDTFDASAFADVVIGNIDRYYTEALRCDKLRDTVNGIDTKGPAPSP